MNQHPDSALRILSTIDTKNLPGKYEKALYSLLMSQALDKNYIDISSDTIISAAVDYFPKTKDSYRAMLTFYYLGRICYNASDYSNALVNFFRAYEMAKEQDEHFWAGMATQWISDVFNETYNSADELKYANISLEEFRTHGVQPYIDYAIFDVAKASHNNLNYAESISLTKNLIDSAKLYGDNNLNGLALRLQAVSYYAMKDYGKSLSLFKEYSKDYTLSNKDSVYMGTCLVKLSKINDGKELLNNITVLDDGYGSLLEYELYLALDDKDKALTALDNLFKASDKRLKKKISVDILSNAINYYNSEKEKEKITSQNAKMVLWIVVIISFIILFLLIVLIRHYILKQKTLKEANIAIATNYKEIIKLRESEYNSTKESVELLLRSKFEILDNLTRTYYENPANTAIEKKITRTVTDLIKDFTSSKNLEQLEALVNRHSANIMANFRTDFPNLKDADYHLFLLSVLSFSSSSMALFLNVDKMTAVYERKRRLKNRIKASQNSSTQSYLHFLE